MVQTYFPFDQGAGANITEAQWTKMAKIWADTGVIYKGLRLEVFADSSGMQVKVKSGIAWLEGHYFESDAEEILSINPADPSNPRIDRVIIRLDWTANTIQLAVLQGTPAVSPVVPILTKNSSRWEIPLAQVRVNAGALTITAGNITDEREFGGVAYNLNDSSGDGKYFGMIENQDGKFALKSRNISDGSMYKQVFDVTPDGVVSFLEQSYVYARKTVSANISSDVLTRLTFETEVVDKQNEFSSTKFTPKVSGYYLLNFQTIWTTPPSGDVTYQIYENGSTMSTNYAGSAQKVCQLIRPVYLTANKEYEFYVNVSNGTSTAPLNQANLHISKIS